MAASANISTQNAAGPATSPAFERHYAPDELAEMWGLSADTVRRLFAHEPGVLVIEGKNTARRTAQRRYRTLRIPESVALRVHRRNSLVVLNR